jgi:hypothetical protein
MRTFICTFLFGAFFLSGCSTIILVHSLQENNNITIDGNEKDWTDRTFYLNEQNIVLGIRNDRDNLFLFIKSIDPQQMRLIHRTGLTVWLDPSGSDGKKYGIRIPAKNNLPDDRNGFESRMVQNDIFDIEIITKEKKEPVQIPVVELKGIQFASSRSSESLIIECKIPLYENAENPLRWNVTGNDIGITLETGKMERQNKETMSPELTETENVSGQRPSGGRGYGGGRGGGGGRRREGVSEMKQTIKKVALDFWFKVRLAEMKK